MMIQIGITLVAILTGALGSIQIAYQLEPFLVGIPIVGEYAFEIAEVTAVIIITYLSLVLGELAPKQIALNAPENVAAHIAPAMTRLARLTRPLVRFFKLIYPTGDEPAAHPPL